MIIDSKSMEVLCIDVGNTNTHLAIVGNAGVVKSEKIETESIARGNLMGSLVDKMIAGSQVSGVSFCSVVPGIYPHLLKHLRIFTTNLFNLTAKTCRGLRIDYPNPSEIGQDRLANAVGAQAIYGVPSIVIDMGTAITLDVISPDRGYEGGVIAPGLKVMSKYLNEKTALLPEVNPDDWTDVPVLGRSTKEAMGIGCKRGFAGMLRALVEPIYLDLKERAGNDPEIILAGGDARHFPKDLFKDLQINEDITLIGLFVAYGRFYSDVANTQSSVGSS